MEEKNKILQSYNEDSIQVLEGLEPVRKRPGMYIGSTGPRGLHHLVWEIVDNSIDEALAGFCTHIEVEILPENIIAVTDNGRGMPIGIHHKTGRPAVETIFTVLHAGGKFNNSSYKVSGGLHGVGASVVNALSEWLTVQVRRDGKIYEQTFKRGIVGEDLKVIGTYEGNDTGSRVIFKADYEIFQETLVYDYETLRTRIQQLAFLNKGLRISITDRRNEEILTESYMYEGGIKQYVEFLNQNKTIIHKDIIYVEDQKTVEKMDQNGNTKQETIAVEVALQYNDGVADNVYSFTNNINTHEGGTHEEGFRLALNREINKYATENNLLKKDESLSSEDTREGLTAIISVKHPDPQFEGQTKTKLGNTEVRQIVSQILGDAIHRFMLEHPNDSKIIIDKCLLAQRARIAARKAREAVRKSPLGTLGFASKLADCRCKEPEKSELYIVEGDSAGGSAKTGRESEFQAILPLRGKVLNVEKAREDKIYNNREILTLIQAIGAGIKDEFDIEKARYHKIVIMADADVDGEHIATLLLTFFFRYMKPLIEAGYIYVARPPLYKAEFGKKVYYAYSDAELEKYKALYPNQKASIQRYKGLGEMDANQLWETTMDPANRILIRVTLNDAMEADQIFSMLMGEEVEPRRKFIEENAVYAELDA